MPHQAPLRPGDPPRVGRYRLAGRITGIPSDGAIFLGTGPDGTEVLISMLHSDWAGGTAARDRFAAEAAVAKRVPPFCAARMLDAGLQDGRAYLVSEYVPGRSLLEVVSAGQLLAAAELGPLAIGMATGLASVHQAGLVHGNFGPEYVIMTAAGPRVIEFGITPPYGMATPSADMLAWAQSVMFAAAGRPAASVADLDVLPYYLRDLVLDCLSPVPSERPAARAAVLALIGEDDIPAGVLAEGSRRAAPGSPVGTAATVGTARVRPASGHAGDDRAARYPSPPPARPGLDEAGRPDGEPRSRHDSGRSPAPAAGPRPASRHSRAAHDAPAGRTGPGTTGPSGWPGQDSDEAARGGRLGLRTGVIGTGAVLVIAIVVVAATRVLGGQGSSPQAAISRQHPKPAGPQSGVATPPPTPLSTTVIPAAFSGAWSGSAKQPPNDTYDVALILHKGRGSGQVSYSTAGVATFSCALGLAAATDHKLTLTEASQGSCTAGTVTLTLTGGSIWYVFRGGGLEASGSLTRG